MEYSRSLYKKKKHKYLQKITEAGNELDSLHKIIPVCSNCKKIRSENGAWEEMEKYIKDHD